MKKLIVTLLALAACWGVAGAGETKPATPPAGTVEFGGLKWYTTIDGARKAAAEKHKHILMLFTGSDWCPYCKKLDAEIITSKEFKSWSAKVVLYLADAKGGPSKISPEGAKLMTEYDASGFPTVVFSDAKGRKTGKTGYTGAKPADYCRMLDRMRLGTTR